MWNAFSAMGAKAEEAKSEFKKKVKSLRDFLCRQKQTKNSQMILTESPVVYRPKT